MRRSGPYGIRLPRAVCAAVVGSLALVLASCGTPKYEYLQDDSLGTYFKVPHGWTVLNEDLLLEFDTSLSPSEREARKANGWTIGASPRFVRTTDGSVALDPSVPFVLAKVFALSQEGHDVLSNRVMENWITDLTEVPADQYTDFGARSVVLDGGYRGIRRSFERRQSDGTYADHIEQVLTNPQTNLLYTLQIVCTPDCFEQYGGDISAVLGSWTIKEP